MFKTLLEARPELGVPASAAALPGELALRLPIPPADRARVVTAALDAARQALDRATAASCTWCGVLAKGYPRYLAEIVDPPIGLWVRGEASHLGRPSVAVVGARQATPSGLAVASRLAAELAERGLIIVSGLARGVDGAAHQAALEAGGLTVAVLGCGPDVVYPREHDQLARQIADRGAVVSEFPPATPPLPFHFPRRNRVISGLSRAVIVIEASDRSGSLITARAALEQGRDVLAVPGSVASGRYRGGHALIKDGARLVETVNDVLEEIGWEPGGGGAVPASTVRRATTDLEAAMAAGETYSVDQLAERTGYSASRLLAELAELELSGRVVRSQGVSFTKLDRTC